jgi:hypothetical protein
MGYELADRVIHGFLKQEMQKLKRKKKLSRPNFCVLMGMRESLKLRKERKKILQSIDMHCLPH